MKASFLEKSYITVLMVIFAGIVVHAPLSVWLGTVLPDQSLLIKSWKEILLIIAVALMVGCITKRKAWQCVLNDRINQGIAVYIVLHLILVFAMYQGVMSTFAGLAIDLRYVIFFGLMYVSVKLFPQYRKYFIWAAVIGACVVVGFATVQLFLPADILSHIGYGKDTIMPYLTVDKNPDFIRVNSTLRGPNPLGAYTVMCLALVTAALIRKRLYLKDRKLLIPASVFTLCSFIALWISYSRSALVAGLLAVLIVLFVTVTHRISRKVWIMGFILIGALTGVLIAGRDSSFVSNVLLHENRNGGSSISSNEQHIASLSYGIDRLAHQPLGAGVGSTGSASLYGTDHLIIENQYLFIAHETGWLGIILFVYIFVVILYRLWRIKHNWLSLGVFASGVGLGLIGLIQPVWVDDTVSIVWWGLAAIALAGKEAYERKQTK